MKLARCPLCRARLERAAECPRCGADLSLAENAQAEAVRSLEQALACLAAGDRERARARAQHAKQLHRTALAEAIVDWLDESLIR